MKKILITAILESEKRKSAKVLLQIVKGYFMIREKIVEFCPYRENHAVSLCQLRENGFLCVWFAGSKEGGGDVSIWGARRLNGQWEKVHVIAKISNEPHWNPVLFRAPDGIIRLFFKVGSKISSWRTYVMSSFDDAKSWTKAEELVAGDKSGGRGPVKNKPLLLQSGKLLAPASIEKRQWRAFTDIGTLNCQSWEKSRTVPMPRDLDLVKSGMPKDPGAIQPALWESEPNHVHMLLRTNCGTIFRSDSTDGGLRWRKAYSTGLPNNNSGLDVTTLPNGELVLIANADGGNWASRGKLVIRFSKDNGLTWSPKYLLENSDSPAEFSYPAIISDSTGTIALAYTWKRKNIEFISGQPNDFKKLAVLK